MIKSTIRTRTYRAIYRLLDRVSPVDYDCGTLCGAACCMVESEPDMEMGIYLLPEEGELIMIYDDTEVPYACPLIEETLPLNDDFVKATTTVWRHLIRDPLIYDLVKADSEDRYE